MTFSGGGSPPCWFVSKQMPCQLVIHIYIAGRNIYGVSFPGYSATNRICHRCVFRYFTDRNVQDKNLLPQYCRTEPTFDLGVDKWSRCVRGCEIFIEKIFTFCTNLGWWIDWFFFLCSLILILFLEDRNMWSNYTQ